MVASESIYKRTSVYLKDIQQKPKHLFTVIGDKIKDAIGKTQNSTLLDVGGASGDLAHYMVQRFPEIKVWCLDADKELIAHAKEKVKNCRFIIGDANNMVQLSDTSFDFVTMLGVLSIFDDFTPSLKECIRVTKKGGTIIVVSQFNDYPVDALVKWRYSGDSGAYNKGYNLFSKKTISAYLSSHNSVQKYSFEKFILPFDLPKQKDPIRTWTEKNLFGRRIFRNGLMEVNLQLLTIKLY